MMNFFYEYGLTLELFVALFLFTINLEKRKCFILRNILLILAIAFFCFIRANFPPKTIYTKTISYIILYIICFAFNYFIYNAPFRTIVYCTISGIIAQHTSYILSDFFRYLIEMNCNNKILSNCIYIISTVTIYILLFFIFSFHQNPRDYAKLQRGVIIVSSLILFIICIFIIQLFEFYRSEITFHYYVLFVILDTSCCISIYLIQKTTYISAKNAIEIEIFKNRINQYESLQNVIEVMNIRIHDLKHQLHKIEKENSASPEAIMQLNETISKYKSFSRCGNDVIDAILTEKNIKFEKESIKFTYFLNGKLFDNFSTLDIHSIFGNALDNAIEYLITIPKENRFLTIRSFEKGDIAKISFENTYIGNPKFNKQGLLDTTKDNAMYHGFGLKSIKSIMKKYNGSMSITIEDNTFKLQLLFPKIKKESE